MNEYKIVIEEVPSVSDISILHDKYPDLKTVWVKLSDNTDEHWHLISEEQKICVQYRIPMNSHLFNF